MRLPVEHGRWRDTMGDPRTGHTHRGTDIEAPEGTPIRLMHSARVVAVLRDESRPCGLGLVLDDAERVRWTYCHMRHVEPFERGAQLDAGDFIGTVGRTGNAVGPHLHIQAIRDRGRGEPISLAPILDELRAGGPLVPHSPTQTNEHALPKWLLALLALGAAYALTRGGR